MPRLGGAVPALAESYRASVLNDEVGRILWQEQAERQAQYKMSAPLEGLALTTAIGHATTSEPGRPKVTLFKQFYTLLRRAVVLSARDSAKAINRLARTVLVSLVTGAVFWQLDDSQAGAVSKLGAISVAAAFLGYDSTDEIPQIFQSRSLFYAQRNAGYYNAFSYFVANLLADLPILIVQAILFSVIMYPMIGMRDGVISVRFLIFIMLIFQTAMAGRAWTALIANLVQSEGMAFIVTVLINDIFWYFQGYFRKSQELPDALKWINFISYFARLFQAFAINELDGLALHCASTDAVCRWETGNDLLNEYYWDTGDSAFKLGLESFVFIGLFYSCSIACMKLLNFELAKADDKVAGAARDTRQHTEIVELGIGEDGANIAAISPTDVPVSVPVELKASGHGDRSGICLIARAVHYHVGKLHLLQNINMFAKPGMLIALMGASGAGKSTLIDVIAQRKTTGNVTGSFTINGQMLGKSSLRKYLAYVEQFDALPAFCTVREVVECNAKLRLSADFPAERRSQLVTEILERLRLTHIQDDIADSLSGAARKKVSIAAELASIQPQAGILLCDEPTTGLDSPAAMDIVSCISNVSEHTPVICTIHQPSMELFASFNWILLLRAGGIPAYFGPSSQVADFCVRSGFEPPAENENIAEYVLKTICKGPPSEGMPALDPVAVPLPDDQGNPSSGFVSEYRSVSWWTTFAALFERRLRSEIRDKMALGARLICSMIFGLMIGCIFYQLRFTYAGMIDRMSFFFCVVNNVVWGQSSKVTNIVGDRPSYYRELSVGMYGEISYYLAWSLAETPFIVVQIVCTCFVPYFMAGLSTSAATFFTYVLTMWLAAEASSGGIHFLTAISPDASVANGIIAVLFIVFMVFSGFLLLYSAMPSFAIVFFYISVFRYAVFSAMAGEAASYAAQAFNCEASGLRSDCRDEVLSQLSIDLGSQWQYIGEMCLVLVGFRLLAMVALKTIKHIKR